VKIPRGRACVGGVAGSSGVAEWAWEPPSKLFTRVAANNCQDPVRLQAGNFGGGGWAFHAADCVFGRDRT
jgi:hypothetical protein